MATRAEFKSHFNESPFNLKMLKRQKSPPTITARLSLILFYGIVKVAPITEYGRQTLC